MRDWYRRELETGLVQPSQPIQTTSASYYVNSNEADPYRYASSNRNGPDRSLNARTIVDELLQSGPHKKRDLIDRAYAQTTALGNLMGTLHMLVLGGERVRDPTEQGGIHISPPGTTWFCLVSFSGEKTRSPMHPVRRDQSFPEYSRGWNEKFAIRCSREDLPLVSLALIEDSRGNRRSVGTTRFRFDRLVPGGPPVDRSFPLRKHSPDGAAYQTGTIHVRLWFEAHEVQPRPPGTQAGLGAITGGVPPTPEKGGLNGLRSSFESSFDIAPSADDTRAATPPPRYTPPAWDRVEAERRARAAQAARMRALRENDRAENFLCGISFCS